MLINWFTVFAQIVNFLILVVLLKRFLYGPIIRAMEERERNIAAAKQQAEQAEAEAQRRTLELIKERQTLAEEKEQVLAEARAEIGAWRERSLGEARAEVEGLRRAWMAALDQERQVFLKTLQARIVEQVVRISEKAIQDLANGKLENQVVAVFLQHIEKEENRSGLEEMSGPVRVQSGFQLDDKISEQLRQRFAQWFPRSKTVEFEIADELGVGIRVVAGDRKLEWNLTSYLGDLEAEILTGLFKVAGAADEKR